MSPALTPISRWTDAFLDSMRKATDPEPDALVAEIFEQGGAAEVSRSLGRAAHPQPAAPAPGVLRAAGGLSLLRGFRPNR